MEQYTESVKSSIREENWHAALIVTLILPDIAGKIDNPGSPSNSRYADWFDKYVGDSYKHKVGVEGTEQVFLTGNDCYALRCSQLHEGTSTITHQRARDILDDFMFVAPKVGTIRHCNLEINVLQENKRLQLQVDLFCWDILQGVEEWLIDISSDSEKQAALSTLLNIYNVT